MFSKTAEALGKAHQAQRLRLSSRTDPVRHAFNEGLADTLVVIAPSLDNIDHFATVNKAICLLRMLEVD
jgi:hypothetical protein